MESALARLGHSLAGVKIWGGAAPPGGRNMTFEISRFGWVNISRVISGAGGLNFTNAGLTVLDNVVYRLSISLSSPKIFAVKLESCRKTY